MSIEREVVAHLRETLAAAERALEANDMVTYRALSEKEARLMDELRAIWSTRAT